MMKALVATGVVVMLTIAVGGAQVGKTAATALEAAIRLETVEGDLRGAIQQYRDIVARFSTDRPIAARALLRLGTSLQRIGDSDASAAFERIIADYPEQLNEVRVARAALSQKSEGVERQIWFGDDVPLFAAVSPDGKSLAFIDYEGQRIAIRDIASGRTHTVIAEKGGWSEQYLSFAPDGHQIAYAWLHQQGGQAEMQVRVVRWSTAGSSPDVRVLARFERNKAAPWVGVYNWSRDARRIAVQTRNTPHGAGESPEHELGTIDVSTGQYTPLAKIGARIGMGVALAPDGRHVAYDSPANEVSAQRDIRVLPVGGGQEQAINPGPGWESVIGWSGDGGALVYTSEVNGVSSLFAQPFTNGRASGSPRLLRSAFQGNGLALTARGDVLVSVDHRAAAVHVASVDPASGKSAGQPLTIPGPRRRNGNPQFSKDGSHLAFISSNAVDWGISERVLTLLSLETQQPRMIPLKLAQVWTYDWSPERRSFLARATDYRNRMGIYQIDAASGEVKPILTNGEKVRHFKPHWKDSTSFYYTRGDGQGQAGGGGSLILHDLSSGRETLILSGAQVIKNSPDFQGMVDWMVSPDGRYIAGTRQRDVWLISVADATARPIFRSERPILGYTVQWTPDATSVYVMANTASGGEVWRVPIEGTPVKMETGVPNVSRESLSVHPDGRRVAVQSVNRTPAEIRVLEGVLPPARP